jgi:hypothetical protein
MYIHADIQIKIKEQAMAKTKPVDVSPGRNLPSEQLLAFLEDL